MREVGPRSTEARLSAETPIVEWARKPSYEAAWKDAARRIAAKGIFGLLVRCPSCHRTGTLLSKWIKSAPVKPLYVCHTNGNGYFKACSLDKGTAALLRRKVGLTRSDIVKVLRMGKSFVMFSGGKDSLCLLDYLNRLAQSIGREITALHADTTAGFPEVERYVRRTCKVLGVRLVTVRPHANYFDLAKRWGIPGVKSRWCCKTLKIAPIRRYLSAVEGPRVVFDGIRAAESNLRATYIPVWYHPSFRCINVSPIFGWSDEKVSKYIQTHDLPKSPAADLNTSAECWCGAYKTKSDFQALLSIHPEIFGKLVEVEQAQNGKYTFLYECGKHIPLCSLREKGAVSLTTPVH